LTKCPISNLPAGGQIFLENAFKKEGIKIDLKRRFAGEDGKFFELRCPRAKPESKIK
jgi:hypothetical protein